MHKNRGKSPEKIKNREHFPEKSIFREFFGSFAEVSRKRKENDYESKKYQDYMTDFLCTKQDGDLMVRECVFKSKLSLPRTCKLLDISREYWSKRGVTDWAIVIDKEDSNAEE